MRKFPLSGMIRKNKKTHKRVQKTLTQKRLVNNTASHQADTHHHMQAESAQKWAQNQIPQAASRQ